MKQRIAQLLNYLVKFKLIWNEINSYSEQNVKIPPRDAVFQLFTSMSSEFLGVIASFDTGSLFGGRHNGTSCWILKLNKMLVK